MDNVKIVFKNYPLNFHKMAAPAALAGIAAAKQGKFWSFHDLVFENYKSLSEQKFITFAEQLKLDMNQFKKDMKGLQARQRLEKDMRAANNAGVTGTPSIFINGRKVGKRTLQNIQQMIDAELK